MNFMIVSKQTVDALYELIKQCFAENRLLDRCVSVLGVKFACNQSSGLIHKHIAHYFPNLSDKIGESTLERYNIPVVYGETPAGAEDYSSVAEIIHTVNQSVLDFQSMMMGVCRIALDNNDIHVYANLIELLRNVNLVVEQTILLSDKIDLYGDNIMAFDHDIKDFWILEDYQ